MPVPLKHPLPPELNPAKPVVPDAQEAEPAGDGNEDPGSELDTLTPEERQRIVKP